MRVAHGLDRIGQDEQDGFCGHIEKSPRGIGGSEQAIVGESCEAKVRLRRSIEEERRIVRARCFGSQFTLAKNNRAFRMPALSGGSPENFPFHFVAFPTASLLSLEGFAMVAEVTGVTNIERRVVNLLAHPFLPCPDRRAAVGALVSEAFDHFCPRNGVRNNRRAISVPTRRHCRLCKLLPFDGQNRFAKGSNGTQKVRACAFMNTIKVLPLCGQTDL